MARICAKSAAVYLACPAWARCATALIVGVFAASGGVPVFV